MFLRLLPFQHQSLQLPADEAVVEALSLKTLVLLATSLLPTTTKRVEPPQT
ncbi:MAG: hypothetical protein LBG52_03035 [Candidatus Peribacteria bacterium]|nr:hypothetical protein [Candidatus Peribacteria bacterium]